MKRLALFAIMAAPALIGSIAVGSTEGAWNFCAAVFFSVLMIRESTKICLILKRHWRMDEQEQATIHLHSHWDEAEMRPVRVRASVLRRDIYHRR